MVGYRYRSIALSDAGLSLEARSSEDLTFSDVTRPVLVTKIMGFTAISVPLRRGGDVTVAGVRRADADDFVSLINTAWRRHFAEQVEKADAEIRVLAEVVGRLLQPRRYPSACLLEPFLIKARRVLERLPTSIPDGVLPPEQQKMLDAVIGFQKSPMRMREAAIKAFVDVELAEMQEFMDTIESNPLTPEQRLAVATDEDATLVLAGAGSGKTSVIVAKAAYLIQRGIRPPNEILLMAFGKDAAAEMANRIEERSGAVVDALTFHALGYGIIREVEGGAPALAPHASDDVQFRALLRDILINDVATKAGLGGVLLRWFSEFYWPYKSEWDFKTKDEYYQYVEAHDV
jgi:DNA helicase-4